MVRTFIGGLVAGLVIFVVGFIFKMTPLAELAYSNAEPARGAAVQTSLAQNLTESGTGTYIVPGYKTAEEAVLYGKGPIATVHFNTQGASRNDMSAILPGFIVALITGTLIAFGLRAVAGPGIGFAGLARLVVLFSSGITIWTILAQPIFNHYGWGYWIYSFIAETAGLIAGGLIVAKWFLPRDHLPHAAAAPREEAPHVGEAPPVTEA
jgi:hypothetical protein